MTRGTFRDRFHTRSVLFYCTTKRDREIAEQLTGKLSSYLILFAGSEFGGPFKFVEPSRRFRSSLAEKVMVFDAIHHLIEQCRVQVTSSGNRSHSSHVRSTSRSMSRRFTRLINQLEFKLLSWTLGLRGLLSSTLYDLYKSLSKPIRGALAHVARAPVFLRDALRWTQTLHTYILWKFAAQKMIRNSKCSVVILFEENAEGLTLMVGRAASRANVPHIIIPQTTPNPKEPAVFYGKDLDHNGERWLARLITLFFRQWTYVFEGQRVLRLPVRKIVAQHLIGYAPRRPWILNSGDAEIICVECEAMRQRYLALGFPEHQLRVTGHPVDDTLFAAQARRSQWRAELERKHGLTPGRPLILVGFPPNQYTSPDVTSFEWPTFKSMCQAWIEGLAVVRPRCNVVIRAHPRLQHDDLRVLEEAGFSVSWLPTEMLVPLADVYVACISATIRWALALGIPVVNYDCYRYRYDDYADARGVRTVEDSTGFRLALRETAWSLVPGEVPRSAAQTDRERWGIVDGHFFDRFIKVLDQVHARTQRISARSDVRENATLLVDPLIDRKPQRSP